MYAVQHIHRTKRIRTQALKTCFISRWNSYWTFFSAYRIGTCLSLSRVIPLTSFQILIIHNVLVLPPSLALSCRSSSSSYFVSLQLKTYMFTAHDTGTVLAGNFLLNLMRLLKLALVQTSETSGGYIVLKRQLSKSFNHTWMRTTETFKAVHLLCLKWIIERKTRKTW